jgi:hypothetical protein
MRVPFTEWSVVAFVSCVLSVPVFGATLASRWDFEQSLAPTVGSGTLTPGLTPVEYESITIDGVSGYAARWPQGTSAAADEQFFTVPNGIGANGGGAFTNQYTVVMDVRFASPGGHGRVYQPGADRHRPPLQ